MDEQIEAYRERLEFLVPINNLSSRHQNELFASAQLIELKKGETLFQKGDSDPYSFYLIDGGIDLTIDGQLFKHLDGGSNDARNAMAQLQPRQMSARATVKETRVVRFERQFLQRLLTLEQDGSEAEVTSLEDTDDDDWMTRVIQSELFSRIPSTHIQKIFSVLEPFDTKKGESIIRQDEEGEYYYVIKQGRCEVTRTIGASSKSVRLATLKPGDSFGEEALVGNTTRNATVTMLTDGIICRMTKTDFSELIEGPVLQSIDYESALELIETGASWLDVRFADEHAADGIAGSLNIPANMLRVQTDKLNPGQPYITYSTTGERGDVAAYLLSSLGFNATSLKGGLLSSPLSPERSQVPEPADAPAQPDPAPAAEPAPAPEPASEVEPEPVPDAEELNRQAANLEAGMARAEVQYQEARRLESEVKKARDEVEKLVADRVAEERERLNAQSKEAEKWLDEARAMKEQAELKRREVEHQVSENLEVKQRELADQERLAREKLEQAQELKAEAEKVRSNLEQQVRESLYAEREAVIAQEQKASAMMQEAERMKVSMQQAREQAEADLKQRLAEREAEMQQQQQAAEARLRDEERRLRELYESNASEVSKAEEQKLALQKALEEERRRARQENEEVRRQMQEMQQRLQEQEAAEQQLRQQTEERLQQERRQVEAQLARQVEMQEMLKREKREAEQAREKARKDAESIIEQYKTTQQQRHQQELQALKKRQQEIEAAAVNAQQELEQARKARQQAEIERRKAETQTEEVLRQQASHSAAKLDQEVQQLTEKAALARNAARAATEVVVAADASSLHLSDRSEEARSRMSELRLQLEADLQNWVEEQERIQSSTLENTRRLQYDDKVSQIKTNVDTAARDRKAQEENLFSDVAALLGGDDLD